MKDKWKAIIVMLLMFGKTLLMKLLMINHYCRIVVNKSMALDTRKLIMLDTFAT